MQSTRVHSTTCTEYTTKTHNIKSKHQTHLLPTILTSLPLRSTVATFAALVSTMSYLVHLLSASVHAGPDRIRTYGAGFVGYYLPLPLIASFQRHFDLGSFVSPTGFLFVASRSAVAPLHHRCLDATYPWTGKMHCFCPSAQHICGPRCNAMPRGERVSSNRSHFTVCRFHVCGKWCHRMEKSGRNSKRITNHTHTRTHSLQTNEPTTGGGLCSTPYVSCMNYLHRFQHRMAEWWNYTNFLSPLFGVRMLLLCPWFYVWFTISPHRGEKASQRPSAFTINRVDCNQRRQENS